MTTETQTPGRTGKVRIPGGGYQPPSESDATEQPSTGSAIKTRDAQGHWLPGNIANPFGRPKKPESVTHALREKTNPVELAVHLLNLAYNADDHSTRLRATEYIYNRLEGTPRQTIDVNETDGPLSLLTAILTGMRERRGEVVDGELVAGAADPTQELQAPASQPTDAPPQLPPSPGRGRPKASNDKTPRKRRTSGKAG